MKKKDKGEEEGGGGEKGEEDNVGMRGDGGEKLFILQFGKEKKRTRRWNEGRKEEGNYFLLR